MMHVKAGEFMTPNVYESYKKYIHNSVNLSILYATLCLLFF